MRCAEGNGTVIAELRRLLRRQRPIVCSINLGEVHYTVARRFGAADADDFVQQVCNLADVDEPTLQRTLDAARLVAEHGTPWADAHAAATAIAHGAVLWVGDHHLASAGPWSRRDLRKLGVAPTPEPPSPRGQLEF